MRIDWEVFGLGLMLSPAWKHVNIVDGAFLLIGALIMTSARETK